MAIKKDASNTIVITPIQQEEIAVALLGTTPLIFNSDNEKMRRQITDPDPPLTRQKLASRVKHDPVQEFRDSAYRMADGPTYLGVKASAIKGCMRTGALDLPGAAKTQIGRLTHVVLEHTFIPIYGIPFMASHMIRQASINRTPDMRFRAIVPEWCIIVRVRFVSPNLNATGVVNLLNAAGITAGIGDYRAEKGAGNYGSFQVVQPDDPEVLRIMAEGGREVQEAAMAEPVYYDADTESLVLWYLERRRQRG